MLVFTIKVFILEIIPKRYAVATYMCKYNFYIMQMVFESKLHNIWVNLSIIKN